MMEAMMQVYDKLKRSDDIARDNRVKIANLASKVDACIRTVGGVGKLQASIDLLFKNFKEHEVRIIEQAASHKESREKVEWTLESLTTDKKQNESRLSRCEALNEVAEEREEAMQVRI